MAFEEVELFEAAVEIGANIIPGVIFPVDICVCPLVGEVSKGVLESCLTYCCWNLDMKSKGMGEYGMYRHLCSCASISIVKIEKR